MSNSFFIEAVKQYLKALYILLCFREKIKKNMATPSKTSFLSGGNLISFASLTGTTQSSGNQAIGLVIKNYLPNLNKPTTKKKLFEVVSNAFKANMSPSQIIMSSKIGATPDLLFPVVTVTTGSGAEKKGVKRFGCFLPPCIGLTAEDFLEVCIPTKSIKL